MINHQSNAPATVAGELENLARGFARDAHAGITKMVAPASGVSLAAALVLAAAVIRGEMDPAMAALLLDTSPQQVAA